MRQKYRMMPDKGTAINAGAIAANRFVSTPFRGCKQLRI